MKTRLLLTLAVLFAALSSVSRADAPAFALTAANTHVTLAISSPGAGDSLRPDPTAFGGSFATNDRPYNPVVTASLPSGWTAAQVWVHQRGGPFQLKGNGGGSELQWVWDQPATWTWVNYGTFTRAQLSDNFLFIRADKLAADAGIDAVVVVAGDTKPAPADLDVLTKQAAADLKKK